MVFAGLVGAILWNLLTWLFGLPSSSSHALFGGLIGAVVVGAGSAGVNLSVVVSKVLLPALVAPLVAGLAAALATKFAYRITRTAAERRRRRLQVRPGVHRPRWSPWPTARPTARRPWASSPWC